MFHPLTPASRLTSNRGDRPCLPARTRHLRSEARPLLPAEPRLPLRRRARGPRWTGRPWRSRWAGRTWRARRCAARRRPERREGSGGRDSSRWGRCDNSRRRAGGRQAQTRGGARRRSECGHSRAGCACHWVVEEGEDGRRCCFIAAVHAAHCTLHGTNQEGHAAHCTLLCYGFFLQVECVVVARPPRLETRVDGGSGVADKNQNMSSRQKLGLFLCSCIRRVR